MAVSPNINHIKTAADRREDDRFSAFSTFYREKWELVSDLERARIRKAAEDRGDVYDESNPKDFIIAHLEAQLELMKAERTKRLQEFKVSMVAKYNQGKAGRREMVMVYSSTYGEDKTFPVYDYETFEKKDYGEDTIKGMLAFSKKLTAEKKEKKEKGEMTFMKEKGELKMVEQKIVTDLDLMYIIDDVFDENCGQLRYLLWVEKMCSARKKNRLPHSNPLKPNSLRRKVNIAISIIGAAVSIAIIVA